MNLKTNQIRRCVIVSDCMCLHVHRCVFVPVRSSVCAGLTKSGFCTSNVASSSDRKHMMFTFGLKVKTAINSLFPYCISNTQ